MSPSEAGTLSGGASALGGFLRRAATPTREERREEAAQAPGIIERVSYPEFLRWFDWKQGTHITEIGPTGYGKTTLAIDLLTRRDYIIAFGTKKEDDTLDRLIATRGFVRVETFGEITPEINKAVIWPRIQHLTNTAEILNRQRSSFEEALFAVFRQGKWTIYIDELRYLTDKLGLKADVELLWEQGRSSKISVLAGYQRPRGIPLLAYDQPEKLVFFKETDYANLDRIAQVVSWIDRREMIETIRRLPKYDFLMVDKEKEQARVSRVTRR